MAKARTITIYGLVDPRTAKIRYIGKTNNPKRRLFQHIKGRADQRITPVRSWVASLVCQGIEPGMITIEQCEEEIWEDRERHWIKHFKDSGFEILNVAEGGNQPACSNEQRRKNAIRSAATRERGIWLLLRQFGMYVKEMERAGRKDRVEKFKQSIQLIRGSSGEVRQKLNEYGLQKLGARHGGS